MNWMAAAISFGSRQHLTKAHTIADSFGDDVLGATARKVAVKERLLARSLADCDNVK